MRRPSHGVKTVIRYRNVLGMSPKVANGMPSCIDDFEIVLMTMKLSVRSDQEGNRHTLVLVWDQLIKFFVVEEAGSLVLESGNFELCNFNWP